MSRRTARGLAVLVAAAVGVLATAGPLGGLAPGRPPMSAAPIQPAPWGPASTEEAASTKEPVRSEPISAPRTVSGVVAVPLGLLEPLADAASAVIEVPLRLPEMPARLEELPGLEEVPAIIPDPPSIEASMADGLTEDQIEEYRDLAGEVHVGWEVLAAIDVLVGEKEAELTALAQEEAERQAAERARAVALAAHDVLDAARDDDQAWSMPLAAGSCRISARFGAAGRLWSSGRHTGQDFAAAAGTPIRAVRGGTVEIAGRGARSGWAGLHVELAHPGGWTSLYAHASRVAELAPGEKVAAGDVIGWVGSTGNSTGPHLHLEIHRDGKPVDPGSVLAGAGAAPDPGPEIEPDPDPLEPVTVEPVRLGVDLDQVAASLDEMLPRKRRLMAEDDEYLDAITAAVPELEGTDILELAQNWRSGRDRAGDVIVENED